MSRQRLKSADICIYFQNMYAMKRIAYFPNRLDLHLFLTFEKVGYLEGVVMLKRILFFPFFCNEANVANILQYCNLQVKISNKH